jgi:high-affinity nickel-transport protein
MALIDSLDSILMLFTYTWAYINPVRKLFYNLTITTISVVVAIVVALIDLVALIGEQLELENGWWNFWYFLADSFEWIGIIIVGAFIITWAISSIVYRLAGYRDLEKEFDDYQPHKIKKEGADQELKDIEEGTKTEVVSEEVAEKSNVINVP